MSKLSHLGDIYAYAKNNPWGVRFYYVLRLIAFLGVLFGISGFLFDFPILIYILGPLIAVNAFYIIISHLLILFYAGFNIKGHKQFIKRYFQANTHAVPKIDVFVMTAGEELEIIEETLQAAVKIEYPNFQVHVFDDAANQQLAAMCFRLGVFYHTRPNRGWMKKAGNLYYAYSVTNGDYALVLDADFVPHPSILMHTVPYLQDPKIGILQTPHVYRADKEFYKERPLEAAAGKAQEGFYEVVNTARNAFDAALCVGTNALYNRKMIIATGGNALSLNREDMQTGINAIKAGFKVKYLPIRLAIGDSPSNLSSYFSQQNRWCRGTIADDSEIPKIKLPYKLNLMQKIWYKLGGIYYLRGLITLLLTLQTFFIVMLNNEQSRYEYILYAVPFILVMYVLPYLFSAKLPKLADALSGVAKIYIYTFSIIQAIFRISLDWVPTGNMGKSNKKVQTFANWVSLIDVSLLILAALVTYLLQTGALFSDPKVYLPSIMIVYNFGLHFLFYIYAHWELINLKRKNIQNKFVSSFSFLRFAGSFAVLTLVIMLQLNSSVLLTDLKIDPTQINQIVAGILDTQVVTEALFEQQNLE